MKAIVIDSKSESAEEVSLCLEMRWPNTSTVSVKTGAEGIPLVRKQMPDIVILDIDLPDVDGFHVCKEIRSFSDVPIIIVAGCADDQDIVKGLEWGADDYIVRPFSYIQFLARVQAVIRRVQALPMSSSMQPFVTKDLAVHFDTRVVRANGKNVKLTNIEYNLLFQLIKNAGRPVPANILLTKVWGPQYGDMPPEQEIRPDPNDPDTVLLIPLGGHIAKSKRYLLKVHIQHLRKKIESDPGTPRLILTDRGIGYRFVPS